MKIKDFFLVDGEVDIPADYVMERFKNWRSNELLLSDWTQLSDVPVDSAAWAVYRKALRDLPLKGDKLGAENLPTRPE